MKKCLILILCLLSFGCSYTNEERCLKNMPLIPEELDGFVVQTIETKNHQFYNCLKRTNLIDKKQLLILALRFQDAGGIKETLDNLQPYEYSSNLQNSPEIMQGFNNLEIEIDTFWPSKRHAQQVLLAIAIESDNLKMVKQIINKGASIFQDVDGKYPINIATSKGNLPIVKFLVEKGADVTLREKWYPNGNALYYAISSGSVEIVKFLVNQVKMKVNSHIAEIEGDYRIKRPISSLEAAIHFNELEITEFLLQRHANPNELCMALENNHMDIAKLLIRYNANVNDICQREGFGTQGLTPLDVAFSKSNDDVIRMLLSKKAKHYKDLSYQDFAKVIRTF